MLSWNEMILYLALSGKKERERERAREELLGGEGVVGVVQRKINNNISRLQSSRFTSLLK